jgi:DNA-binding MarR family transcriptional regulator
VNQSNASRHCARLCDLGLVTRTRATDDGRAVEVRLTLAGTEQIRAVREARRDRIQAILEHLTDRQARAAVTGLEVFASVAHQLVQEDELPLL